MCSFVHDETTSLRAPLSFPWDTQVESCKKEVSAFIRQVCHLKIEEFASMTSFNSMDVVDDSYATSVKSMLLVPCFLTLGYTLHVLLI